MRGTLLRAIIMYIIASHPLNAYDIRLCECRHSHSFIVECSNALHSHESPTASFATFFVFFSVGAAITLFCCAPSSLDNCSRN
jgi:hypothetical protein